MENNKTRVNHEAERGKGRRVKENEAIHTKQYTRPTHAQLVRMTLRRGYTTVSDNLASGTKKVYKQQYHMLVTYSFPPKV
jgi:hypothetical protein